MDILLIRPKPHKETLGLQHVMVCEPLELEYIASNIEPLGHQVNIVDMILEKKSIEYFIEKYKPDVVGITGYISHINVIKNYASRIKEYNKNIKIIVGGVHAEVNPRDFSYEDIDYIIRANGIKTFINIIKSIENNEKVNNDCVYQINKKSPIKEHTFDYLPPDRNKVSKYRNKYYYMFHRNCSIIKTSFGCPYNCKFCFCRQITDKKYFYRELDDIISELKSINEKEIYIVDDDFLVNKKRLLVFFNLLKENNIKKNYLIYGRADFISNNEDVIKEFKEVGLRAVIVGLESYNNKDLDAYNKNTGIDINENAVKILKKYDVECYGTFITGIDWDKNDFLNLERWIKKLGIVFINLQPLTPLKGTEIYEQYKNKFLVSEEEYEKWDLAHLVLKPTKMSIRKYYLWIMRIYMNVTTNIKSVIYMIRKYGLYDTIKLSFGAYIIFLQYLEKVIRG